MVEGLRMRDNCMYGLRPFRNSCSGGHLGFLPPFGGGLETEAVVRSDVVAVVEMVAESPVDGLDVEFAAAGGPELDAQGATAAFDVTVPGSGCRRPGKRPRSPSLPLRRTRSMLRQAPGPGAWKFWNVSEAAQHRRSPQAKSHSKPLCRLSRLALDPAGRPTNAHRRHRFGPGPWRHVALEPRALDLHALGSSSDEWHRPILVACVWPHRFLPAHMAVRSTRSPRCRRPRERQAAVTHMAGGPVGTMERASRRDLRECRAVRRAAPTPRPRRRRRKSAPAPPGFGLKRTAFPTVRRRLS